MNGLKVIFWSAMVGVSMLAANAQAAIVTYGIGATNLMTTPQVFTFGFSQPSSGLFNFAESGITATVTDTGNDGATLTFTLVQNSTDGVNAGVDLSFDCTALAGGSNTCTDSASAFFGPTISPTMQVSVQFTLSGLDTVSISGQFEITHRDPPVAAPEPGTLALFGAGLAGIGLVRRKRRGAG